MIHSWEPVGVVVEGHLPVPFRVFVQNEPSSAKDRKLACIQYKTVESERLVMLCTFIKNCPSSVSIIEDA
jgi:hypothetical protein